MAGQDPSAAKPEKFAETEPTDGLWIDDQNRIYLSTMQNDGVKILGRTGR
ncbi:hypothetical protein PH547_29470 [Rhizobium sp. CNPSo 3464]|nr:hypothetical protein [Rhizobium sp. CNPSo 3464]MDK4743022.1 hypothetical protein [Rhizobium sp. CNPSo 3464]